MGTYSYFVEEENINVYDEEFYKFLKKITPPKPKNNDDGFADVRSVIKWYDDNRDKKTKELPKFSFAMFDDWKIQSYWYEGFCKIIHALTQFLKDENVDDDEGSARFDYEDGMPFEFRIEYKPKKIWVNYVPPVWEKMELKDNFKKPFKIPQEIKTRLEELEVEDEI